MVVKKSWKVLLGLMFMPILMGHQSLKSELLTGPPARVEVKEIQFNWGIASQAIELIDRVDFADVAVPVPEFISGVRNEPAAYVKNSPLTVKITFSAAVPLDDVEIWAEGSLGGFPVQVVQFQGGTSSDDVMFTAQNNLPDIINNFAVVWNWKYRIPSVDKVVPMKKTSHVICTTHTAPLYEPVYKQLMLWTCDWAKDKTTTLDIVNKLINKLHTSGLKYGIPYCWYTSDLLDYGGGMCYGWSGMFKDMTGIHGIYLHQKCFLLQNDAAPSPEIKWEGIVIKEPGINNLEPNVTEKEWRDVDKKKDYPDPVYISDNSNQDDVEFIVEKRYMFYAPYDGHCINFLEDNGEIYLYDPSFGTGPFMNTFTAVPSGLMSGIELTDFREKYHDIAIDHMHGKIRYRECNDCSPIVSPDVMLDVDTGSIPDLRNPLDPISAEIRYFWF